MWEIKIEGLWFLTKSKGMIPRMIPGWSRSRYFWRPTFVGDITVVPYSRLCFLTFSWKRPSVQFGPVRRFGEDSHVTHVHANSLLINSNFISTRNSGAIWYGSRDYLLQISELDQKLDHRVVTFEFLFIGCQKLQLQLRLLLLWSSH